MARNWQAAKVRMQYCRVVSPCHLFLHATSSVDVQFALEALLFSEVPPLARLDCSQWQIQCNVVHAFICFDRHADRRQFVAGLAAAPELR